MLPNYVRLCLTMTGKTIASRRADAISFIAAEMEALEFAVSHRDETIRADANQQFTPNRTIRVRHTLLTTRSISHAIDPSVTLPIDKLNWMQNELVKAGNLKAPFDLTKMTAPDIRAEAAKRATK